MAASSTPSAASGGSTETIGLRREVGLFGGISVLAGIMIGSGIFYIGGIVLERSGGNLGLALLVWAVGGLITLLSGICFAELGAMMPKAGGYYVYLREAYGERVAFMCGITNFFLSSAGSISALKHGAHGRARAKSHRSRLHSAPHAHQHPRHSSGFDGTEHLHGA